MKKYELAKKYYEHYGNLKVPYSFVTYDGINRSERGYRLGRWVRKQREAYRDYENNVPSDYKMTQERINLLEQIGMIWRLKPATPWQQNQTAWEHKYELVKAYYEHYGHTYIPPHFRSDDGITYNADGEKLGTWVVTQKRIHNKYKGESKNLSKDKIELLEKLEIDWTIEEFNQNTLQKLNIWHRKYKLAKAYYEHYGNLLVPEDFKTNDGINYDEEGTTLGVWIKTQRKRNEGTIESLSPLTEKEKKKLNEIGMVWDKNTSINKLEERKTNHWNEAYEHAKAYYNKNGNLNLKLTYVTEDGYRLGNWISSQRSKFKKNELSEEQINKLNEIGMIWDASVNKGPKNNLLWNDAYEMCVNYRETNNHLDVPVGFKTKDGIIFDEDGHDLGLWIIGQRKAYDAFGLTEDKINKLKKIGMVFYPLDNLNSITKTCNKNNIEEQYVNILNRLPASEVKAKIRFLKNNNLPIIENDSLNPIFFMSSKNIEAKYGITLEQIIEDYKKSKKPLGN